MHSYVAFRIPWLITSNEAFSILFRVWNLFMSIIIQWASSLSRLSTTVLVGLDNPPLKPGWRLEGKIFTTTFHWCVPRVLKKSNHVLYFLHLEIWGFLETLPIVKIVHLQLSLKPKSVPVEPALRLALRFKDCDHESICRFPINFFTMNS